MGRRLPAVLTAALSAVFLLAAAASFWRLDHELHRTYGGDAPYLMGRLMLPCMLSLLFLLALGAFFWSTCREGNRGRAIERGQFYLLSHFSSTYLFEFDVSAPSARCPRSWRRSPACRRA